MLIEAWRRHYIPSIRIVFSATCPRDGITSIYGLNKCTACTIDAAFHPTTAKIYQRSSCSIVISFAYQFDLSDTRSAPEISWAVTEWSVRMSRLNR